MSEYIQFVLIHLQFIMNPFYKYNQTIHSVQFENKIKQIAEKYLY